MKTLKTQLENSIELLEQAMGKDQGLGRFNARALKIARYSIPYCIMDIRGLGGFHNKPAAYVFLNREYKVLGGFNQDVESEPSITKDQVFDLCDSVPYIEQVRDNDYWFYRWLRTKEDATQMLEVLKALLHNSIMHNL
jgi:hypothetical protein